MSEETPINNEDKEKSANNSTNETSVISSNDGESLFDPQKLGMLNDISILLTIEIGRTQIKFRDLLGLTKDSIIDLNKQAGEPVDVYANGKLISKGNIITANGKYCVRLTAIPQSEGTLS